MGLEARRSAYQFFRYTIGANDSIEVSVFGRFVILLENSSSSNMFLSIGQQPEYEFPKGISLELPRNPVTLRNEENQQFPLQSPENFTRLKWRNPTGASVTIDFAVSAGVIVDNRTVISGALSVSDVADTLTTPAAISVPTTAPGSPQITADASIKEVHIHNNDTTNVLWYGGSNVDGSSNIGIPILPLQTAILSCNGNIYLRAVGGTITASVAKFDKS